MPNKKVIASIAIVLIAVAGCAVYFYLSPEGKGELGEEKIGIKIGVMPDEATLPYYVAAREGIFANRGLDVEVVPFHSAMERDSALNACEIDACESDPVGIMVLRNAGYDVRAVSLELQETPEKMRFAILASPNSNVNTLADLEGKEIAISRNTIIEWITDALLGDVNVKKIEVKKVPIRMQMLLADEVEAATLPEPLASYAIHKGAKLIISDAMLDETVSQTVIAFRGDFIKEHPSCVYKFLDAYSEAVERINTNPENYRELLIEVAKIPKEIASSYKMVTYMKPQPYPRDSFAEVLNWMRNKNLVQKDISYEDVINERA
ncbi:hypothetical protein C5S32_11105 [ANME-1 cluster archaeon GoMg1]|nr:hypothetical protein [ANME-1 cluster archaeon GoMg1]